MRVGAARRRIGAEGTGAIVPFDGSVPRSWPHGSINGSVYYIVPLR